MAEKAKGDNGGGMRIDTDLVRELAQLLEANNLTEIEVEDGNRKIRSAAAARQWRSRPWPRLRAGSAPHRPPRPADCPGAGGRRRHLRRSPMVGTAFLSAEPGAKPFAGVGDTVKAGDTLMIIEAMKVMNPITAPDRGQDQASHDQRRPAGRVRPASARHRLGRRQHGHQEIADRQPGRDCAADSPRVPRNGHQDGRGPFDRRHRRDARPAGRRDGVHRPARGRPTATSTSPTSSRRRKSSTPTPSTPATASSAKMRSSPRSSKATASSGSGPSPSISAPWATRSRPSAPRPRSVCRSSPVRTARSKAWPKAKDLAAEIGYPVLIKAASGGGGRGMKVVPSEDQLESLMSQASNEAKAAFGDPTVYMEKYLGDPRHIEFQVFGDGEGNAIHLGERDCSLQRRHQKVLEEAPSPVITPEERERMGEIVRQGDGRDGLSRRRHDRIPLRERRILLHRDEHPAAGRASGDRDDQRGRSGARADPRRQWPGPVGARRRRSSFTATPSNAASTPRTPRPSRPRPAR